MDPVTEYAIYGSPAWVGDRNEDCPDMRAEYIDEYEHEFARWIKDGYPELLDEFLEYAPGYGCERYDSWLN